MIEINKNPSRKELHQFGALLLVFFTIVGYLAPQEFSHRIWMAGGAFVALYFLIPPIRRPIYVGWLYAVFPIGWTVSHVILLLIYYGVFTPTGLLMRLFGYDPMTRKIDRDSDSYWVAKAPIQDKSRYFNQY